MAIPQETGVGEDPRLAFLHNLDPNLGLDRLIRLDLTEQFPIERILRKKLPIPTRFHAARYLMDALTRGVPTADQTDELGAAKSEGVLRRGSGFGHEFEPVIVVREEQGFMGRGWEKIKTFAHRKPVKGDTPEPDENNFEVYERTEPGDNPIGSGYFSYSHVIDDENMNGEKTDKLKSGQRLFRIYLSTNDGQERELELSATQNPKAVVAKGEFSEIGSIKVRSRKDGGKTQIYEDDLDAIKFAIELIGLLNTSQVEKTDSN